MIRAARNKRELTQWRRHLPCFLAAFSPNSSFSPDTNRKRDLLNVHVCSDETVEAGIKINAYGKHLKLRL